MAFAVARMMGRLLMVMAPILLTLGGVSAHQPTAAPIKVETEALPFGKAFGGPFRLTDQDGRVRTDQDFRGRYMLIVFGYTFCPDICPLELSMVAEVLDGLGAEGEKIQPIFVTIDPARDTVPVLKDYVASFHPRLVGLTGTEPEIAALAKAYRVHRRKVVYDPDRPADYLVDHGSFMYLMGPDGAFRTLFPYGVHGDYDQAIERISGIIKGYLDKPAS